MKSLPRHSLTRRAVLAGGGAFAAALASPAIAQAPTRIIAAYGQTTLYNAPIWIAQERGLFRKYGLECELVQLTGARITQGLVAGSVQFISSSASSAFLANLGGGETLLVGSMLNKAPWDFVVTPRINAVGEVRGKTGALALRGDFTEVAMRLALAANGLDFSRDVNLVQGFGTDAERIAVLVSGSADFTVVNHDFRPQYERAGLRRLFSMMDLRAEFVMSGIFTTRSFARRSPDAVTGYLKAMGEALHVMATDADVTVAVTARVSQRPAAEIAPTYAFYVGHMERVPTVSEALVRSSLRALEGANPRAATADPATFYDASFMQRLQSEGFFDRLRAS